MINIWFCNCSEMNRKQFDMYAQILPEKILVEVNFSKFFKDKSLSLVSRLLIRKAIIETGNNPILLEQIERVNNKPFIKDWMSFNISHSKDFVTLAFSEDCNIGIDIEAIDDKINVNQLLKYFSVSEKEKIQNNPDEKLFFDMWVRKEAFLKAKGYGILNHLNHFDCNNDVVNDNGEKWFLKKIEINQNYISYLATNVNNSNIKIQEIFIDDLKLI